MIDGLTYVALSDIGEEREENQDYQGHDLTHHGLLFIVADGMGGHAGGATASQMVVNHMKRRARELALDHPEAVLEESIRYANRAIWHLAQQREDLYGMGSTVVALLIREDRAWVAHVGDSRIYLLRGGRLIRLTKDHTMVQRLVDEGFLTEEQAERHPSSHILARSLGGRDDVEVEVGARAIQLQAGDTFLLCSDGLTGPLSDMELGQILFEFEPHDAARLLVDEANARGGYDNSTLALVRVDGVPIKNVLAADVRQLAPPRPLPPPEPTFPPEREPTADFPAGKPTSAADAEDDEAEAPEGEALAAEPAKTDEGAKVKERAEGDEAAEAGASSGGAVKEDEEGWSLPDGEAAGAAGEPSEAAGAAAAPEGDAVARPSTPPPTGTAVSTPPPAGTAVSTPPPAGTAVSSPAPGGTAVSSSPPAGTAVSSPAAGPPAAPSQPPSPPPLLATPPTRRKVSLDAEVAEDIRDVAYSFVELDSGRPTLLAPMRARTVSPLPRRAPEEAPPSRAMTWIAAVVCLSVGLLVGLFLGRTTAGTGSVEPSGVLEGVEGEESAEALRQELATERQSKLTFHQQLKDERRKAEQLSVELREKSDLVEQLQQDLREARRGTPEEELSRRDAGLEDDGRVDAPDAAGGEAPPDGPGAEGDAGEEAVEPDAAGP